ncbi:hypothetical protein C8J56DRAFT_863270 [Mycena floridula]|nr:hypothetical protein C8J56DRAFT_863270 [Mycena floridula]
MERIQPRHSPTINRSVTFARGFILGGSSSINGLFYTRGSSSDWDRYAQLTGDSGWSWERLRNLTWLTRSENERWTRPADGHDITGQFDPSVHGLHGINSMSLAGHPQSINGRVIKAATELGGKFKFNQDMNGGSPLGLGWLQATIKGGTGSRSSAATSYLAPQYSNRPNLHILLDSRVRRILETNREFRTVEFQDLNGVIRHVAASKEVLLSAGTVGTPQILLLSGIGNKTELSALGISPLHDLPCVGRNLSDHPRLVSSWSVNGNETFDEINRNQTLSEELLESWKVTQKGPLVDTFVDHLIFARLNSNATIFNTIDGDPAAGIHSAHYELGVSNGMISPPPPGNFLTMTMRVVSPTSRGSVQLNTTNPLDSPLIDPAFLTTEFDIFTFREAVKDAFRFLSAPAWKGYVVAPTGDLAKATNDELLEQYIRNNSATSAHLVGTASMTSRAADYGVVDPDLKLKGLKGLRIVDASVLPFVPSAHTQAAVYVVAERASDMIKEEWE